MAACPHCLHIFTESPGFGFRPGDPFIYCKCPSCEGGIKTSVESLPPAEQKKVLKIIKENMNELGEMLAANAGVMPTGKMKGV